MKVSKVSEVSKVSQGGKYKKSNTQFLVIFLIALSLGLLFGGLENKNKQKSFLETLSFPNSYYTSLIDPKQVMSEEEKYPAEVVDELEQEMKYAVKVRCTLQFVRIDGGHFLYPKTAEREYPLILLDNRFLAFMSRTEKSVPRGKKFLNGRFCDTGDHRIYFTYVLGIQPQFANESRNYGTDMEAIMLEVDQNGAEKKRISITGSDMMENFGCDQPILVTKAGKLYFQCQSFQTEKSVAYFYLVDVKAQRSELISNCTLQFRQGKVEKECI